MHQTPIGSFSSHFRTSYSVSALSIFLPECWNHQLGSSNINLPVYRGSCKSSIYLIHFLDSTKATAWCPWQLSPLMRINSITKQSISSDLFLITGMLPTDRKLARVVPIPKLGCSKTQPITGQYQFCQCWSLHVASENQKEKTNRNKLSTINTTNQCEWR